MKTGFPHTTGMLIVRVMAITAIAVVAFSIPSPASAATGPNCYVDANAVAGNTGNDWTNAYTDLQSALGDSNCDVVYVAQGLYKPTASTTDRTATFSIPPGMEVYGGYPTGGGSPSPSLHVTVLSGDIDGDDSTDPNGVVTDYLDIVDSNSYHVVTMDGTGGTVITSTTVLDGFTITAGQANAVSGFNTEGGGMICYGQNSNDCSPTLNDLVFSGNLAKYGGGFYGVAYTSGQSSPALTGVTFTANHADVYGGAMYLQAGSGGGTASPTLYDVTFSGNTAVQGAGMFLSAYDGTSNPTLTVVSFEANIASSNGGGMYITAAASGVGSPVLDQVVFSGNDASYGGGAMYNSGHDGGTSSPSLTRVVFYDNSGGDSAGAMFNDASGTGGTSSPTVQKSLFALNDGGNGGAVYNYAAQTSGTGVSSAQFANVTFTDNHATAGQGGAVYNNADSGATSSPTFTNVTFNGNDAGGANGGAVANVSNSSTVAPAFTNVILWGDSAGAHPEIYNTGGATPNISYSVVEGSGGSGSWDTALGSDGGNNLDADPRLAILADNGGFGHTMALIAGSSAIDTGYDATCSAAPVNGEDQRGETRPAGPHCDIGAYEGEIPAAPTDFEPDGKTDPAKYVPGAGAVYYYQSSTSAWDSAFIGTDGDYILNSDFDGDAVADAAKYVAAAGAVWYLGSTDGAWHGVYVGNDGEYIPASDFDGDRITDPAKYVAAAGAVWYYGSADSTWHGVYMGGLGGGDYVPGSDFDGDGKTDPAHTDSAGNVWYIGSSDSTLHGHFIGADGPYVPRSDYDGDGITDPAKFASSNIWYLASNNSNALTSIQLGDDTSFVVPGSDFDGDGTTDPAKFVDSADAIWYTRSSDAGSVGVYMGNDTYDIVN